MTPEQAKIIDKKIEEIAEILYQNKVRDYDRFRSSRIIN
jgi:hypothetical protein